MGEATAIQKIENTVPAADNVTDSGQAMITMIERVVMDPSLPIERLEKVMEMQERWEARQAKKSFEAAVAMAKSEIGPITKNRTVEFTTEKGRTHYQHEDFAGIATIVDPVIAKFGLAYRFKTGEDQQRISVTCILSHKDGHTDETTLKAGRDESGKKNNIQAMGSTITYLQRYTLKAALGLASAHDDDGKRSEEPASITDEQLSTLRDMIEKTGSDIAAFCRYFGIEALPDLPKTKFNSAIAALSKKAQK